MSKVQKAQSKVSSGFKSIGGAILGLGALTIGVDLIKGGIEDMFAAEKAARDFERQIRGMSKNVPADLRRMDRAMQEALSVNVDDTEFQTMVTGIIRRLRVDVPKGIRVGKAAVNLAAAGLFDTPAEAAGTLVKALEGNKRALDKLGVPMRARKNDALTLAFLEKKYGDAATENAQTLPGQWKQLETQFGEFVEGMVTQGTRLAGEVPNLVDAVGGDKEAQTAAVPAIAAFFASLTAGVLKGGQSVETALSASKADFREGVSGFADVLAETFTAMRIAVATATAPLVVQGINLGRALFNAITGETDKLPEAVGADIKLTQEQLNQINTIQARREFNLMIQKVKDAMETVPDDTQTMVNWLEAIWAATSLPGLLGAIFRGGRRLSPFAGLEHLAEGGIVTGDPGADRRRGREGGIWPPTDPARARAGSRSTCPRASATRSRSGARSTRCFAPTGAGRPRGLMAEYVRDTFTRATPASGWGTGETGGAWTEALTNFTSSVVLDGNAGGRQRGPPPPRSSTMRRALRRRPATRWSRRA